MNSTLRASFNVKKIAIVGAGPSGLAAAKFLVAEKYFDKIDIIEQQAEVGGVWNYTPNTSSDSVSIPSTTPNVSPEKPIWPPNGNAPVFSNPMYDRLHTNIPKTLMCFSDRSFRSDALLFPTREDVQEYLVHYSGDVRHLIRFSEQVRDIRLDSANGYDQWEITSKSTITTDEIKETYDAVVIANGHYSVPFIPDVPGIKDFNSAHPSIITHSKIFRSPDSFVGKKVIVVGNGASGLDIGKQISRVCKKPLLNSVRTPSDEDDWAEEVPPISEFLADVRGVKFDNGRIEKDIDAIVYCTGYFYSYPFLNSLDPPVVTTGRRVAGSYQHVFNIQHPTLAFTALAQKVIPFPISEVQSAVISKVWSNKLVLPNKEEMNAWEEERVKEHGNGTSFHIFGYPHDAEYINGLHDWVKGAEGGFSKEPTYWDEKKLWIRRLYADIRNSFIADGEKATTMEELGYDYEKRER
ncbi:hypothetical protein MFRU_013g01810 [Monilinia fructicola]|nr:hypothetical protein MFRU_013g01810 [Monilinia fructicola]